MRKNITCVLSIILILFSCFTNCTNVSAKSENDTQDNTPILMTAVNGNKSDNSFLGYYTRFIETPKSSKNVIKYLDKATLKNNTLEFSIDVEEEGLYGIGLSYRALDEGYSDIELGIKIDGEYPFSEAESFHFPRMWRNQDNKNRVDAVGNEFAPFQIVYNDFYYNEPICTASQSDERYFVYLNKGEHTVVLVATQANIQIDYFEFSGNLNTNSYITPNGKAHYYKGKDIVIEGEDSTIKSSYFLTGKSDTSSVNITPQNAVYRKINYIGGGNWKNIGETLVWETPELEEGYYNIGFSYRQNISIGSKVYRKLTIDGEMPFSEAKSVGFNYGDDWQKSFFEDENNKPYLLYFSKGTHKIALTASAGEVGEIRDILTDASEMLGDLYIDITMITGDTVDLYRDYELFKQIGNMQERLEKIKDLLNLAAEKLLESSGEKSGSNYSIIMNMIQVITQMLNNKYEAHRYKDYYYTNYCSVSSVIQNLNEMPLALDKIVLTSPETNSFTENASLWEKISFSIERLLVTFTKDYTSISSNKNDGITVWVSWGRDQAQVLSSLIDNSFTPKTGIEVDLKLANASIVQATILGDGPDCLLMSSRSDPVNLAMRGVLYDLSNFDDCNKVLTRFQKNADVPYRYKDGLYALPDTQNFFVMYYRKDILDKLNIKVPVTWEDFSLASKILMRNNMNVCLPNNPSTDPAQANAGVGSNNIFPTLLLQKNIPLYKDNGKSTNLLSSEVMEVMETWTNFYSKQKFPLAMDFYTRFRIGTTPLGINTYTFYTTLKAAASEIDGLWGVTSIPGTIQQDGSISNVTAGGGTGCSILKRCDNYEAAWEFLKWWTSSETQLSYSKEIEAILGPTGRIAVANVEAFRNLDWDSSVRSKLLNSWENVQEIPEYPGSYYVSRSIYQSFWNVVNANKNPKDMLMKYGKEADSEIERKWKQYYNR